VERWLIYSILSLLIWGAWGAVLKEASRGLSWRQLYFYSGLATVTAVATVGLMFHGEVAVTPRLQALLALLAGTFGTLGYIFMVKALEAGGKASVVVPLTSLYPAVTVILAYLALGERISPSRALGVALAIAAIYLLSRP
jgi:transporter family protein